ncbi:C2H2-type zinc finger protein [Halomarina salina]|uniref:C2H2-type zinc finger protein n=1 Tax=Halomarina salina TaxID=1872699 RepID=A0ABD5RJ33_9EURY|nr:C2H2-type zinc finger protein [Halomarina salina]
MSADTAEPWETVVTDTETFDCEYCGRPFAREQFLALHYGVDHPESIDDEQRAAYAAALEEEDAELRKFRLKALLALVVVYFGFLLLWAVVNLAF